MALQMPTLKEWKDGRCMWLREKFYKAAELIVWITTGLYKENPMRKKTATRAACKAEQKLYTEHEKAI